jgi:hypothetical protein
MQEKELETLRPIMDELHGKICAIQYEMARRWTDYTGHMANAQEYTQKQVAELQKQVGSLEQENSHPESSLAPIGRLPPNRAAGGNIRDRPRTLRTECLFNGARMSVLVCYCTQYGTRLVAVYSTTVDIAGAHKICSGETQAGPSGCSLDLNPNRHSSGYSTKARGDYRVLALAVTTMPRWKTLTVAALPSESDVAAEGGEGGFPIAFSGSLERLEAVKITGFCEKTAPFNQLLDTIATTSTEQLEHIEISAPNALWFLASPKYHSLFTVYIVPYFKNPEVLEAYRLHLPTYHHEIGLPIVRTLRWMSIKIVSVQWMSGRTFPSLEDCTVIWPHHPESLRLRGGVDLRSLHMTTI